MVHKSIVGAGAAAGIGDRRLPRSWKPILPFKLNQVRRHRIPRQTHKVTNWPAYETGLRQRGSLTVWFSDAAITAGSVKNLGRYAASWIAVWPNRPSSTAALTWSTRWAPRGDQRICWRLFMRALTNWLTVPSAREVEIGLPAR